MHRGLSVATGWFSLFFCMGLAATCTCRKTNVLVSHSKATNSMSKEQNVKEIQTGSCQSLILKVSNTLDTWIKIPFINCPNSYAQSLHMMRTNVFCNSIEHQLELGKSIEYLSDNLHKLECLEYYQTRTFKMSKMIDLNVVIVRKTPLDWTVNINQEYALLACRSVNIWRYSKE